MARPAFPTDMTTIVDGDDIDDTNLNAWTKTPTETLKDYFTKGGHVYNVMHPDYGAVCDGSTDDTAAIQAAIDAAHTDGGGMVFFPSGTYRTDTALTLYSNIVLQGIGQASIIDHPSGNYPIDACGSISVNTTTVSGVQIEDCEDAWDEFVDGDVTESADAGDKEEGSASAKFEVAAGCGAGDIIATETISSTDISKHAEIKLHIKSSVALDAGDLAILLDNTAQCASPKETLNVPAVSADTWTEVTISLAHPNQDAAIISVGVQMVVDKGAFDLRIDDVRAVGANRGHYQVVVADASGLSADDWIRVRTEAKFIDAASGYTKQGEIVQIASIASNTLTLKTRLADTYLTVDTATIDTVTMKENMGIRDLKIQGAAADQQIGIRFQQARNIRIENCIITGFYYTNLQLYDVLESVISECHISEGLVASTGYGIMVGNASNDITIEGCAFRCNRHGVTHGGNETYGVNRNIAIIGNHFEGYPGTAVGQINTHATAEHVIIADNAVNGDALASISSKDTIIKGNVCQTGNASTGQAIHLANSHSKVTITDNRIYVNAKYGVYASGMMTDDMIANNVFLNVGEILNNIGIYAILGHDNCQIKGNQFVGFRAGAHIKHTSATAASKALQLIDNIIDADGGSELYGICLHAQGYDNDDNIIKGNIIYGSHSYGIRVHDENAGAGKNNNVIIGNNIINGATTGITIEDYTEGVVLKGNIITNTTRPVYYTQNASATELAFVSDIASISSELDLSGGASDVLVFVAPCACALVGYDITYTEASSADAGVAVQIGRYQDGVALDGDYFDTTTSEVSKNLGYTTRITESECTQKVIAAGDVITVGTAGGKAGTGAVQITLHIATMAD